MHRPCRRGRRRSGRPGARRRRWRSLVILAIDQGTTGTTCLVVDDELGIRGRAYRELPQHFPRPGWVEHDPEEIWRSVLAAAEEAVRTARAQPGDLRAIGITNQRETTLLWERASGRPLAPAIVWQDRRTAERCRELPVDLIRARTGLVPDPYFSATKLEWLLARAELPASALAFGTVDSWLVWKLTGGRVHVTDATNASRTMLLGLDTLEWDEQLLALFGIDPSVLPRVVGSAEAVGEGEVLGTTLPVAGIAGDQQAALVGHGCFERGEAKATYGTGSFVLVHAGREREPAPMGLLETAAAPSGYALEGASLVTGITRGTTRAQLVRAALEAIAFQVADVLDTFPTRVEVLRADGGASANAFLMQFQADLLGCPVEVAAERQTTALGAAALAGLAIGVWKDTDEIRARIPRGATYEPSEDV